MTDLKPIRVQIKQGNAGLLVATSPDLAGLHLIERTQTEMLSALREMVPVLFSARGESVIVTDIVEVGQKEAHWYVASLDNEQKAFA